MHGTTFVDWHLPAKDNMAKITVTLTYFLKVKNVKLNISETVIASEKINSTTFIDFYAMEWCHREYYTP